MRLDDFGDAFMRGNRSMAQFFYEPFEGHSVIKSSLTMIVQNV